MSTIFRNKKVEKASHAHLACMNTFVKKHEAMVSLFYPYIRREIYIRLLIILQGSGQMDDITNGE